MRSLLWSFGGFAALALACSGTLLTTACGGTAVIDADDGAGGQTSSSGSGAGSTTTSTSTSTSSTTSSTGTGTTDCNTLGARLMNAIADAQACNICDDGPDPCENLSGQQLTDTCGCPMPVNRNEQEATNTALAAFQAWQAAGCMPLDCQVPCAVSSDPTCQSTGGPGCDGACAP